MRAIAMVFALTLLAGCANGIPGAPDPRDAFGARNIDKTLVTYVPRLGTQVVHMDADGGLYLWSSAQTRVQQGRWRYDMLATGAATTFQGAGGINYPVEELETAWGVCFQYTDTAGTVLRRPEGGAWNCAVLSDYEALVTDRAPGDAFGLASGATMPEMPAGTRLGLDDLRAL